METQPQPSNHLTAARHLLDELGAVDDSQVKAAAASAHATLVLAEQLAAVRLVLAASAGENGKAVAASRC
jgi:hypothetical protein